MRADFISYMKQVENAELYLEGTNAVHESPEGGNRTVGYGHKLNVLEEQTEQVFGWSLDEIDQEIAELILLRDLSHRANNLRSRFGKAVWDGLDDDRQEMLIDFEFNIGAVERKFPKFTEALLKNDIIGMRAEYKRHYRDEKGRWKPLKDRNEKFYERYLA